MRTIPFVSFTFCFLFTPVEILLLIQSRQAKPRREEVESKRTDNRREERKKENRKKQGRGREGKKKKGRRIHFFHLTLQNRHCMQVKGREAKKNQNREVEEEKGRAQYVDSSQSLTLFLCWCVFFLSISNSTAHMIIVTQNIKTNTLMGYWDGKKQCVHTRLTRSTTWKILERFHIIRRENTTYTCRIECSFIPFTTLFCHCNFISCSKH